MKKYPHFLLALGVLLAMIALSGCTTTFYVKDRPNLTVTVKTGTEYAHLHFAGLTSGPIRVVSVTPPEVSVRIDGEYVDIFPGDEFTRQGKEVVVVLDAALTSADQEGPTKGVITYDKGHHGSITLTVSGLDPKGESIKTTYSARPGPEGASGSVWVYTTSVAP